MGALSAMNFIKSSLSLMDSFCPSEFIHPPADFTPLIMTLQKYTFFLITAKLFFRKLIISYPKKCILRELILEKVYDLTFVIIEKVYFSGYSVVLTIEKQLLPLTAITAFSFTISPAILLQYLLYYNKSILLLSTPP